MLNGAGQDVAPALYVLHVAYTSSSFCLILEIRETDVDFANFS